MWYGRQSKTKEMEESKYKFLNPSLWKSVTADEAMEELERIRKKHGLLKAEIVVEESKDERSVLHKCFQWDDSKAAEAWRKEQARQLIKNIVVVITETQVSASFRALVNVSSSKSSFRSFVPLADAMDDTISHKDLLFQAKKEMEAFISKFNSLNELSKVKHEMLLAIQNIG